MLWFGGLLMIAAFGALAFFVLLPENRPHRTGDQQRGVL